LYDNLYIIILESHDVAETQRVDSNNFLLIPIIF